MAEPGLAAVLTLGPSLPPSGGVAIVNAGSDPLRIWRTGNEWGDDALSFESEADGSVDALTRRPQVYTRNVPSAVELGPGERYDIRFDLGDGTWEPRETLERLRQGPAALTAVYRITPDDDATRQGVWTGEIRSAPVRVG